MEDVKMINAKRDYHMVVAEAWKVYDEAVNPARLIRDAFLENDQSVDEIVDTWKKYNEDTLPARIVFETAIKVKRKRRDLEVARVAKLKSVEVILVKTEGVST